MVNISHLQILGLTSEYMQIKFIHTNAALAAVIAWFRESYHVTPF